MKRSRHAKKTSSGIERRRLPEVLPLVATPPGDGDADSFAATALSDLIDRSVHAATARLTAGLSPMAVAGAYLDWAAHFATAPGKQVQVAHKAFRKSLRLAGFVARGAVGGGCAPCIEPLPQDRRFEDPAWQAWPFNVISQSFLLQQQWWHNVMTGVRGVTRRHEDMADFVTRQWLDVFSPSNCPATNPQVIARTRRTGGMNFVQGMTNFVEDWERTLGAKPPVGTDAFKPGRDVAITPGKVVWRNRLIELIQYTPTTPHVHPQPVLIVPAWIMKYYILDLSPGNSLVRFLVSQGHTVFMVSWKNPGPGDRDLSMEDYRELGVMAALDAIASIVPRSRVHAAGYCIGGTLLAIAAAAMARDHDHRLASVTLLAAQTDFTEPGELGLFVDESQLAFLEDSMWEQGFLDTRQMAGAFQMLRSNDLVWSRMVHEYLMGERTPVSDLMAWNADGTRMPYRMHSEYLRGLFLNGDLAEGRYVAGGKPVVLRDLRIPFFVVATERDHVAPWRSVYKIRALTDAEVTFVLASGGHNVGIVAEPGKPGIHHRIATHAPHETWTDAQRWKEAAPLLQGSWWSSWAQWLAERSGKRAIPPHMGPALADAPGNYVMMQ